MKKSNSVSINNVSHNRDYVKNTIGKAIYDGNSIVGVLGKSCDFLKKPRRFTLKCYSWCYYGGILSDFFTTYGIPVELTRYQIFSQLKSYFFSGSRVSISKVFFSPFNSDPIYKDFASDLSYFYDKLPIAKDYLPVAIVRYDDRFDYILAVPVKDESKL